MFEENIECIIGTLITKLMGNQSSRGTAYLQLMESQVVPDALFSVSYTILIFLSLSLFCQRSQILLVLPNLGTLRQAPIAKVKECFRRESAHVHHSRNSLGSYSELFSRIYDLGGRRVRSGCCL